MNVVSGVRHRSIYCDECRKSGLRGIRWKCAACDDYDLCHDCYMSNKHKLSHAFIRYDTPLSVGYKLIEYVFFYLFDSNNIGYPYSERSVLDVLICG